MCDWIGKQFLYRWRGVAPRDHGVREIATGLDLSWVHAELAPHYAAIGRPSIDRPLMIRMLVLSYVSAIRSERSICREVQVSLAYRWFRGLSIGNRVPDRSAFPRARNERFRDIDFFAACSIAMAVIRLITNSNMAGCSIT
jgi:hypothetical protein